MPVKRSARAWVALVLALFILPMTASAGPVAPSGSEPSTGLAKIDRELLDQDAKELTFWVQLTAKADLRGASAERDWDARGRLVVERLTGTANASQRGLRAFLRERGAAHQTFWIVNTIRVTGTRDLLEAVAARDDVARILPDRTYTIPKPTPGTDQARIAALEWGIDRIRADDVWGTFGIRGEGIVVANIDTGVDYTHPALVNQYRGNLGGGAFSHDYNWFDPSHVCGVPEPCDNVFHGTHVMGTMVGDDGDPGANQIGVAPHARWIAAKGCEDFGCSDTALLASGQWVLAPTRLDGSNPRPDLRPQVVNNSWGDGPGNPFYQETVNAWIASGIFPAFANGNAGEFGCQSSGSPGDYIESYSAGAFDINGQIAFFSSRGPSVLGDPPELKPNASAPGVDVRSSVPGGGYESFSGTSMASPHIAGTVALIWAAAPAIVGDINATRALLDAGALDTEDLSCGGTTADNNVWGEGRLDAYASVLAAPRGPTGTLQGTVRVAGSRTPIAGARVAAEGTDVTRSTVTNTAGEYSMVLPVGTYRVTASAFGYIDQTVSGVLIKKGRRTTQNFSLAIAPAYPVSGTVATDDGPAAGATVTILGTPLTPATTDASGHYSFASVPVGSYDLRADAGRCNEIVTQPLTVDGPETLDFSLPARVDAYGYFCDLVAPAFVEGTDTLPLAGDDDAITVDLPFPFTLYGQTYSQANIATNGFIDLQEPNADFSNGSIPSPFPPNASIYAFWDDLFVDEQASILTRTEGTAPDRRFIVEWRNAAFCCISAERIGTEAILYEDGRILLQYRDLDANGREMGNSATVGIENADGSVAFQYSLNQAVLSNGLAILFDLPPNGFVQGTVTDANDGLPIAGAAVVARQGAAVARQATTGADGSYRMQLFLGSYTLEASKQHYVTESVPIVVDEDRETLTQDFVLETARAGVDPGALQFIVPPGESRTQQLTLTNSGTVPLTWELKEAGGRRVVTGTVGSLEKSPTADPAARSTKGFYVGANRGWTPLATGDVLASWEPEGLNLAWGVGYTGNVWLSDVLAGGDLCGFLDTCANHEFTTGGSPTGTVWPADWADAWNADMAYDAGRGLMCQLNVGEGAAGNGIYCWDPATGEVVDSITSGPWTNISQRGLAYRPDDDSFYVGGWNEGILYHVKGLSHADKGAVIDQCNPPDPSISGLAWNDSFGIIWAATNSETDTIYQLDPATCDVLGTLAHPRPFFNGGGLEMDELGNLWMVSQGNDGSPNTVYLIDSGVPAFSDVTWLSESPASGTLAPGGSATIDVTANTAGLEPGVYGATIVLSSNSGRQPRISIPVSLVAPAYVQRANGGGNAYTDLAGERWAADQRYAAGSWGYTNASATVVKTTSPIAGTDDDPLYQDARQNPTQYRFDGLAPGIYEVQLRFAEVRFNQRNKRIFDVRVEGTYVLVRYDIAAEVGGLTADDHTFFVEVTDGHLDIDFFDRRGYAGPIVNGIGVIHRPDR
jgi:subtilisin family serine protease